MRTMKKTLLLSGILTVILFLVLRNFDLPLHTIQAPNGIVSFELARDIESSNEILSSWDVNAKTSAGLSLGFDFLFLLAYSAFIATICLLVANRYKLNNRFLYKLGITISISQYLAASFDAIENVALIKMLLGSQNGIYPSIAFYFASFKFLIIAIGIIYIVFGSSILLFLKNSKSQ